MDLFRVGKRFRGISSDEISQLVSFLTGSLGEFLDNNYESEKIKTMFLANNVYGKHGGPYQPGTAIGLLFHLLERRRARTAGLLRARPGRHGLHHPGPGRFGTKTRRRKFGPQPRSRRSKCAAAKRAAWCLEDGTEIRSRIVLSNADPKRTFLKMVRGGELPERLLAFRPRHQDGRPLRQSKFRADAEEPASPELSPPPPLWNALSTRSSPRWPSPSVATTSPSSARFPRSFGWIASSPRTPTIR